MKRRVLVWKSGLIEMLGMVNLDRHPGFLVDWEDKELVAGCCTNHLTSIRDAKDHAKVHKGEVFRLKADRKGYIIYRQVEWEEVNG